MLDFFTHGLNTNNKKMLVIIIAVILLTVLIIFGAKWLIATKTETGKQAVAIEAISNSLDQTLPACDKEKNPDSCKSNKVEAAAMQIGAAEICLKLSGDDLNVCVLKVAEKNNDPEACEIIIEDEKQLACKNVIYRALASAELDLSWCEKISFETLRTRCINTLSQTIARSKGCGSTGVDQSICDRQTAFDAAVATSDPAQCLNLADDGDQVNCLDIVGSGDKDHDKLSATLETNLGTSDENADSDGDGLSDYGEYYKYKTDPAKADTDGDGYNDKDEIDDGYNPLGAGKL